ncbi:Fe2+-enterobactin ABC transporter substrate-binding protein [Halopseudomonas maritima]|uniref:Fe2+-enterobactin ABC transporter substrate-binding protein n=1 Tax=Halopseudomonas maritima TaxID=2918528 RepID=UPI001EEC6FF3|nr:Fe2+-enterobactin ABC transporter substrate-binding protein [Halopseudomonas maritima]UJJ29993.1 Fe2+-enterobactin ABC transporter substrate-binding protein [Halopseudomonas maritima]
MAGMLRLSAGLLLLLCLSVQAADWPREVISADGVMLVLQQRPLRVLSTSVTLTGSLLAIDAPVIASATANNGVYFDQWAALAEQRGVERLWPAGSIDLEAAYVHAPDLIVVSSEGADSALAQVAELRNIAPTLVLSYGDRDWQELARQLGDALGLEAQAEARIRGFERRLQQVRSSIVVPPGKANIISYNGAGMPNPIATPRGAHGRLLAALGFYIEAPEPAWHSGLDSPEAFVRSEYEYLTRLQAETSFLLRQAPADTSAFVGDPVLANLPSVRAGQVHGLGRNSFRIDFFSASEIVDGIEQGFAR